MQPNPATEAGAKPTIEQIMESEATYTVFAGQRRVASGPVQDILRQAKAFLDQHGDDAGLLIFEDRTGIQTEFDFRGTLDDVLARVVRDPAFVPAEPGASPARPGRPKLGVVSREVSLLPRHWEWLDRQPNGASAALRRLIEAASKSGQGKERARVARDAAAKVMWSIAGNLPDFEEASRALFAGDFTRCKALMQGWPVDIRNHLAGRIDHAAQLDQLAAAGAT